MGIGSFYNTRGVRVGQAMGLYAPENTPLPADNILPFDEPTWASTIVSLGGATAGNYNIVLASGPLDVVVTTANILFSAAATVVATAITTALNAAGIFSLIPVVSGTGAVATPFLISLVGPGGAEVKVSALGTLTGGTILVTPPAWTPAGSTEQGWQSAWNPQTQDINIEEQVTPVGRNITTATYEFVANLSEDTIDNLQLAMSSARTITAADPTHYGVDELAMSSNLPVLAVVLETQNRSGFPRRYYIPGATCATNVGQTFARARAQHMVPVTFTSVCPTESIKIRNITKNKG